MGIISDDKLDGGENDDEDEVEKEFSLD